jgi:DHA1 family multidrug resistance protein-like MFS transporter
MGPAAGASLAGPLRALLVSRAVASAAAVAIVVALGFGLLVPVLPLYARSFGVPATQVGLVVSAFALWRLLCDLPAGRLVGRLGAARATALGAAIVACSSAAAGLAPSFPLLVLFRGLGGAGSALFSTGLLSYLLVAVPRTALGRAMGVFQGAFLLGSALGPSAGGLLAGLLGLRGPFFVYAGFCIAASAVALRVLPDTVRPDAAGSGRHAARAVRALWRPSRVLVGALGGSFALWWLLSGFRFALVPLYAEERLGLDSAAIGLGLTVSAAATLLLLWPAGLAADRLGRRAVGVPAFVGLAPATAALLLAEGLTGYLLANALYGAVYGAASVVPGALLGDATPRGRAGELSGVSQLASDLGSVLGPVAVGALLDAAGYPAAIALAVAPAVAAAGAIATAR